MTESSHAFCNYSEIKFLLLLVMTKRMKLWIQICKICGFTVTWKMWVWRSSEFCSHQDLRLNRPCGWMISGWMDGWLAVSVYESGERSLCVRCHPPPSPCSFHYVTACAQTLTRHCFKRFYNWLLTLNPLRLSVCLPAGHELLSELQQRRFNGSEGGGGGGGGGQGGEKPAVSHPGVTVWVHPAHSFWEDMLKMSTCAWGN